MVKIYDYVEWNGGQMDGIVTEKLEDGFWNVEFHTGNGGGNFDIHESEMVVIDEIPPYYVELINFFKGCETYEENM